MEAYSALFTRAADGLRSVGAFGEPDQWRADWQRSYSTDEWLDQVPTAGGHSQWAPRKLEELLAGIGAASDAVGGGFTIRDATMAVTSARATA